jgi:hypothetical protein
VNPQIALSQLLMELAAEIAIWRFLCGASGDIRINGAARLPIFQHSPLETL